MKDDKTEYAISKIINMINDRRNEIINNDITLGIIRVGEQTDQVSYEKSAIRVLRKLDMNVKIYTFESTITQEDFLNEITLINDDLNIHGILILAPLPKQLDINEAGARINPLKDVDCINKQNILSLYYKNSKGFAACTPTAVMFLIESMGIDLQGLNVTVVGTSQVVGKPLSLLLMKEDATLTTCNVYTKDLKSFTKRADLIIIAVGVSHLLGPDYVNKNSVIIDVGINVDSNNNITGDVDYNAVNPIVKYLSPVPNGLGTITTYVLALHLVQAAVMLEKNKFERKY